MTRPVKWVSVILVLAGTFAFGFAIVRGDLLREGVLRGSKATLAIATTPEGPFAMEISKSLEQPPMRVDGASPVNLPPGDYFVDVVPASKEYQRKRLKIHLSARQMLALPVVLTPTAPPKIAMHYEDRNPDDVRGMADLANKIPAVKVGKLACSSRPAGAEVWVDGVNTGKRTPVTMANAVELPVGVHEIVYKLNGEQSAPHKIRIDEGQTSILKGVEIPDGP